MIIFCFGLDLLELGYFLGFDFADGGIFQIEGIEFYYYNLGIYHLMFRFIRYCRFYIIYYFTIFI
jgi:hypothetical protein